MEPENRRAVEEDFKGPWWKHPYMVYIVAVTLLFGFLILMGWLAIENDWIPSRGISR